MRSNFLIVGFGLVALGLAGNVRAQLQEDVYVDLSVLDSLSSDSAPTTVSSSQPLFPIIKKSDVVKKQKPFRKAEKKKQKAKVKIKVVAKKEEPKKVDANFVKEIENVSTDVSKIVEATVPVATVEPSIAAPVVEPSIVPSVEPAPVVAVESAPVLSLAPTKAVVEAPIVPVVPIGSSNVEKTGLLIPDAPEPSLPTKEVVGIPSKTVDVSNKIYFEADDAPLSDANKVLVDSIISGFENPLANKIAITAYNNDNGHDVFKKKRQSLNRAIDVRSYLLQKGYKNFSIKVINVSDEEDKINLIEIEELK